MTDVKERGREFLEFLELKAIPELVTKSELLDFVRARGGRISDRQLTFYMSQGLVPKSVRVGSRAGVYPESVQWLVDWIVEVRGRGLSVEAIKELIPLWKYMFAAGKEHRLDLNEFEYVARQHISSAEATYAIPWLLPIYSYCPDHLRAWTVVLKDGTEMSLADSASQITLGFLFARQDPETGKVVAEDFARFAFPVKPEKPKDDPALVVVGIPPGIETPEFPEEDHHLEPASGSVPSPAARTG